MDEAVLHRPARGLAVMVTRLQKILDSERAGVARAQVVSSAVGAHGTQDSNFVLLEFDEPLFVAFVGGLFKNQYHKRKVDADRSREAVEYLRDVALSPRGSAQLIAEMRKLYAGL
jgi:Domain of unknown function (DUF5753)